MRTLLLDRSAWDLVLDVYGNVAVADDPYSQAQDAASAIRLFAGEAWYNTTIGVQYYNTILGQAPPLALLKADVVAAAKSVPGVATAVCYISSFTGRAVTGQVQIRNEAGDAAATNF